MKNKLFKTFLCSCIAVICFSFATASAQQYQAPKQGEVIEKVRAVVGNDIITQSDVIGYLMQLAQQDPSIKVEDLTLQDRVLNMLIDEKLAVAKAIEDSMTVSDEEVEQRWNYQIQRLVAKYGSEKRIEDIFGMSVLQMKNDFREDIKKQILLDRIKAKILTDVKVTRGEVEEFFKTYQDSLPTVPATIDLYHIVKKVSSDSKSKEELYLLAKSIRDSIAQGLDFAIAAKNYSGDPGTASIGGELGWASKGKFFKEFENAAFALQKGAISAPVETPFGFHIIQTLDKSKDSVKTRHILFKFGQNQGDIEKVKTALNEIREKAKGNNNFEELAKINSDETETRGFGGFLGQFPLEQIPPNIKDIIKAMKDGEISEPMLYSAEPKASYHIIYRKSTTPEHKANLEQDYKQIEAMSVNFKQNNIYTEWIQKVRKEMYWEIK